MVEHFPFITESGQQVLRQLQEHPHAPCYTHPGVNRVTRAGLRRAKDFAAETVTTPPRWSPTAPPTWVDEFVAQCFRAVPLYRRYGPPPVRFADLPTFTRADLSHEPWAFVPDTQALDGLLVYNTSGVTGHPLDILTHADSLALYVPLLQAALAAHGVTLTGAPGRVSLCLVCFQHQTYTFASTLAVLNDSGFVKINLNPAEWREPADRARFLNDLAPEVFTGDPLAFSELARLPLTARPRALVSTAMTLLPGLQRSLQNHFDCPVLDVYSLNETGPLAVAVNGAYHLLQPRLYVEVLDDEGAASLPGVRGEITVTGGFNPFLPLVRYRTGDYARLEWAGDEPRLLDIEGRAPVVFRAADGRLINNIDVSTALRPLPLAQFALHQCADGALHLRVAGAGVDEAVVRSALLKVFGAHQALTIETVSALEPSGGKWAQYTRAE